MAAAAPTSLTSRRSTGRKPRPGLLDPSPVMVPHLPEMALSFTVALGQSESVRYDKTANLAKAEQMMAEAASAGAQAIVFPEMFLTGYTVWDRVAELAEAAEGPSVRAMADLARRHELLTAFGFPETAVDGPPYNAVCLIDADGTVLGTYRKTHLFAEEPMAFAAGDKLRVFDTSLGRIGLQICYDFEFPEAARLLTLRGAQVLLVASANMEPYATYQGVYARARAMENGVYVAIANHVGDDGTFRYFGETTVVDPGGRVLCLGGPKEELLFAEVDLSRVPPKDVNLHYVGRRRPDLYGEIAALPER
jgi:5-aminopentanamidase